MMKATSIRMAMLTRKASLVTVSFIIIMTFIVIIPPLRKLIPSNDYNELIDIPFRFIHIPVCERNNNFLILVHTSPRNLERRNLLRETWANINETDVEILFLTGLDSNKTLQIELDEEISKHKNFIHGDFMDTYKNLTYKHVMGLKYVHYHCPDIKYIVKVDDDVFVNVQVLKSFFALYRQKYGLTKNILCTTRIGHSVLREGKWAASTKEYPETIYPPHCPGFAIIYPKRAVELLYEAVQRLKIFFWIDDVHITGTVAKVAGVGHVDISALIMNGNELNLIKEKKVTLEMRPLLFSPMETGVENIKYIFEYIRIYGKKASILDYLND